MTNVDTWRVAAAFVLTLFVVLALGAVVPLVPGAGGADEGPERMNVSSFEPSNAVAADLSQEGAITVESNASGKRILIDTDHSNQEVRQRTQVLVEALTARGHDVRYYESSVSSDVDLNSSLRGADAFVIVAPTDDYDASETRSLARFTDRGGRLLILGEPTKVQAGVVSTLFTRIDLSALTAEYNATLDEAYLFDQATNANNFQNVVGRPTGESSLTEGVDRVAFFEAAPITPGQGIRSVIETPATTRLSSSRRADTYTVAARHGNVTLVGDASLMTAENYRTYDNEVFVGNLAEFLVGGQRAPVPSASPAPENGTTNTSSAG